jgi:hypothetical protein
MTFYRPDEEEIRCSSWDALRRHIADCHKEIDRLTGVNISLAALGIKTATDCEERSRQLDAKEATLGRPFKVTNGDVETWHNLPVLVPVGLIPEGRTPCEVRSLSLPYDKEYITSGGYISQSNRTAIKKRCGECLVLLADKPAQQFEVGKCYRNRRGDIRGPLRDNENTTYVLQDQSGLTYTAEGRYASRGSEYDLIQPAVDPPPAWVPWPWLPDGEYVAVHTELRGNGLDTDFIKAKRLRGYTSNPTKGRWQVTNGAATWLGE